MSSPVQCAVCDIAIDPYGRDGTRCNRCSRPCSECGRDVSLCGHPLQAHEALLDLTVEQITGDRWQVAA